MLVEYGSILCKTRRGETFEAGARDLLCFRPASVNEFETRGPTLFYQAHVAFAPPPRHRATPLLPGVGMIPVRLATGDAFDHVRRAFEVLCMEVDRPGASHQLRAKAQIYELLALVAAITSGSFTNDNEVACAPNLDAWERLRLRIEQQSLREGAAPLAVNRMAREMGLSQEHFSRRFRDRFGLSPRACHTRARIGEAVRLLGATDAPVKQIAFSLGFPDARGLRRTILRHTGLTPSSIRQNRAAPSTAIVPAAKSDEDRARLYSINRHLLPPGSSPQWSKRFKIEYRLS